MIELSTIGMYFYKCWNFVWKSIPKVHLGDCLDGGK